MLCFSNLNNNLDVGEELLTSAKGRCTLHKSLTSPNNSHLRNSRNVIFSVSDKKLCCSQSGASSKAVGNYFNVTFHKTVVI